MYENDRVGVHASHCCPIHGCKYGEDTCPVENEIIQPEYPENNGCEFCMWAVEDEEGIRALADRLRPLQNSDEIEAAIRDYLRRR